jgi:two-component system NarL family response regulator
MTQISTLIADDHPLFREGVGALLAAHPDIAVAGLARDGLEAVALAQDLQPDVVVMDGEMPRCDGIEATRLLSVTGLQARVIILTGTPSDDHFLSAIEAGARGYLGKDAPIEALPSQIRAVARGEVVLAPGQIGQLCTYLSQMARGAASRSAQTPQLTPREIEILTRVGQGDSNKEIARRLGIALPTVKNHVHNVLEKLELRSRWDAAAYLQQYPPQLMRPT